MTAPRKPLGGRAFTSTPHLPTSRLGPGDWSLNDGQARIATIQARDGLDHVIVTEKLDGSCCAVARIGDDIVPLIRAGYPAVTSPYAQHQRFAEWVKEREGRFLDALEDGERLVGEWMWQAHGSRYHLPDHDHLFITFAFFQGKKRAPFLGAMLASGIAGLPHAQVLNDGQPMTPDEARHMVAIRHEEGDGWGWHGCEDEPEGFVWVVERDGVFDFAAKWVRPDKVDGARLPEVKGGTIVLNAVGKR